MWSHDCNFFSRANPDLDLLLEYREDNEALECFETDFNIGSFIWKNTLPLEESEDIARYNESFPEQSEELYAELIDVFCLITKILLGMPSGDKLNNLIFC